MLTKLLLASDVADLLGVTTSYIYTLARRGEIPAIHLGHYWRFDGDAVRAWLMSALPTADEPSVTTTPTAAESTPPLAAIVPSSRLPFTAGPSVGTAPKENVCPVR